MFVERLLAGMKRLMKQPRFVAAHIVNGIRGSDGAKQWREGDSVWGHSRHTPKGGKVNDIRPIPAEMQARLLEIDAEREALKKRNGELFREEQALLAAAYMASKPLSVKECENAPY